MAVALAFAADMLASILVQVSFIPFLFGQACVGERPAFRGLSGTGGGGPQAVCFLRSWRGGKGEASLQGQFD